MVSWRTSVRAFFAMAVVTAMLLSMSGSTFSNATPGPSPPPLTEWGALTQIPPMQDHSGLRDLVEGNGVGPVYVLVEPGIYPSIASEVTRYMADMSADGYTPVLYTDGWSDHEKVRSLLFSGYVSGMVGAVLIGDIPYAVFEIEDDFGEYGYTYFPCDLYYMDLDGTWLDEDMTAGRYDDHVDGSGDVEADVWVGRLYASTITIQDETEATLLQDYFKRNHEYRMGNLSLPDSALVYVDDDWFPYADEWSNNVGLRYSNRTLVKNTERTVAWDYKARLTDNVTDVVAYVVNESVFGPSVGGETGPLFLDNGDVNDCDLYAWVGTEWCHLDEGYDYVLDHDTGQVDLDPSIVPMGPGWSFFAYYNYTAVSLENRGYEIRDYVYDEIVYGPSVGGETGPLHLNRGSVYDCGLYLDVGTELLFLVEPVDYSLNYYTGEIDITPICPLEPGWTFHAFYNISVVSVPNDARDWVSLCAHSAWYYHAMLYNYGTEWSYVMNTEVSTIDPASHFYNLFCCSGGRYSESMQNGCLAGHYLFSGSDGLGVLASTKTGSMLNFGDFYEPLGAGESMGDSFLEWFILNAEGGVGQYSRDWFYGMTLFGDPTLDTYDDAEPEPPSNLGIGVEGDHVILTWSPSPSPDIHHYNVYRAAEPGAFDFGTVWHQTANDLNPLGCAWTDHGALSGAQSLFYVVRAVDHAGNEDSNVQMRGLFCVQLEPGAWSLVSVPLPQDSTLIDDVFANADWEYAMWYDPVDGDHWKTHATFKPPQLNDLADVDTTMGVWLRAQSSERLVMVGSGPQNTAIPLKAGWNLVGYPSLTPRTVATALAGTGYDRVERFDPMAPYLITQMTDGEILEPGCGYWVRVPSDTTWTVDW